MPIQGKTYYIIGLMSGSSLDGLDLAYCAFKYTDSWTFNLIHCKNAPLGLWEAKLREAVHLNEEELDCLSVQFATYLAKEVQDFIQENHIDKIDAVVSHGHTIYHYPEKGITCQIGDGQTLAKLLELRIINNLRQADMDAGGQGAPIVPIGDLLLFPSYQFCLNLGGIANISMKTKKGILAFDICTANQVLNHYAEQAGFPYDNEGQMARKGKVNKSLLTALNSLDFYQKIGPKSLDNGMAKLLINQINDKQGNIEMALATYVEHIAVQIAKAVNSIALGEGLNLKPNTQILLTGGGAFNSYLVERIQAHLNIKVLVPDDAIVSNKEAIVMAFIGVLKLRNEVNVLASVTGAKQDTSCGDIFEKD